MVIRALTIAALSVTSACLPKSYNCSSNASCGAGICEATGFCSYADTACVDGRRYGDLSGSLSGQCVTPGNEGSDAGPIDTPRGSDGRMADTRLPDAPAPFCDTSDTSLVGCWEFEGTLNDASGHANNGVGTSVTFAAGQTGMAAVLTAGSHIAVADSASLTPTVITLEGWVNPTMQPTAGARMGIFDDDGQYGLFIYPGQVECPLNGAIVTATATLPLLTWSHVACTFDGAAGILYINGAQVATLADTTLLGAGNTNGLALGGNSPSADTLVGMIDQFRIYNQPRTAAEICHDAGMTTCP
jgi:hypothetical protein